MVARVLRHSTMKSGERQYRPNSTVMLMLNWYCFSAIKRWTTGDTSKHWKKGNHVLV
jgi:hypothetical protein